jgi:asparagine synthase (glutamine-hydrolysing)
MVEKLRDYSLNVLSEKRLKVHHFFNSDIVNEILADYYAGKRTNAVKVWNLMMFQLWWERYFG